MWKFDRYKFLALTIASHIGLLFVLAFGTFAQLVTCFGIFIFICLFSSTVVYHRLLSHRSWNAPRWYEVFGTAIGIFSFTGTPITRTLAHRYHHRYADQELDPHSPRVLGVFIAYFPMLQSDVKMDVRMVSDLLRDPLHRFCHVHYLKVIVAVVAIATAILGPKWAIALTVAPGALCWMNISICNVFCHLGRKNPIVNSRFLSLLTFGEGWHRNHHDDPDNPNFGREKFDPGFLVVRLLEKRPRAG